MRHVAAAAGTAVAMLQSSRAWSTVTIRVRLMTQFTSSSFCFLLVECGLDVWLSQIADLA